MASILYLQSYFSILLSKILGSVLILPTTIKIRVPQFFELSDKIHVCVDHFAII